MTRTSLSVLALTALVLPLAACVDNNAPADAEAITVESTADACTVSVGEAPSGKLTFSITNSGDDVTEFYLLADDKLRVVSELENIGPGLTRDLVVQVAAGDYYTACKPGMIGDGITSAFTVTDSGADVGPTGELADQLAQAETDYVAYVKDQVGSLVAGTQQFADAYTSGDDDTARSLYASVRAHWERVEPVAESFGDLDPLLDAREADLAEGDEWSGWHFIEKDLWQPDDEANGGEAYTALTTDERQSAADQLVELTGELEDRVTADDFTFQAFQISNGAKELLDEVATGKVTGEEEIWSHTDLWDFRANVDGAEVALGVLRPVAEQEDPDLVAELDDRFGELDDLLAQYGSIDGGFVYYDELTADQVSELAAAVDAVSEPLSHLTSVITDAS